MIVEEFRLPTQIWIPRKDSESVVSPKRIKPFRAEDVGQGGYLKPPGGLWTSSYNSKFDSGWFEWCYYEQPDWLNDHAYLLYPEPCRVWILDWWDDIHEFHERYAAPLFGDSFEEQGARYGSVFSCQIRWDLVVQDVDAVWLRNEGLGKSYRFSDEAPPAFRKWQHALTFSGWDCESSWWSRWLFRSRPKRIPLVDVRCPTCGGTSWTKPPDFSKFNTDDSPHGSMEAIMGDAELCVDCGGTGRVSTG